jgi:hypothetical protein
MADPGLCAACRHARQVQNDRGSVFWLCEASRWLPELPKYPPLPVRQCAGYEAQHKNENGSRQKT